MKILGIDTSSKFLSLGVYDNGKIYEYNLELGTKLSSFITVSIKRVLVALGWQAKAIDYFACGLGPGSFTGLRIGLATIKGFAWANKKPTIGISSLDILARNALRLPGLIIPLLDAKRGLLYCSIYKSNSTGLKRIAPYLLLPKNDFLRRAKANSIILGDGLSLYKEEILKNIKGAQLLEKDYWYPKAHNIIYLALEKIKKRQYSDAFKIKPIYLYPKECQIKNSKIKMQKSKLQCKIQKF